ncbi:hypothetical protein RHMOL_Rhmol13G0094500 [Rhododendron molle]|uniref:Uncharacterized protein n=1 Tax=Rhododendron molle TaxID=49168 RepID=A0ACC0L5S8_RHOML|nr:hypothetical protein RHMOL_Rhmol13G0094500 [Rhododendron molle]
MVVRLRQSLVGADADFLGSLVPFGARSGINRVQDTLIRSRFGSSGVSHISALGAACLQTAPMLLGVSVEWCLIFC